MPGFFDLPTAIPKERTTKGATGCEACGLFRHVLNPHIPTTGEGKLNAFFLGESPGETEDKFNIQFKGQAGSILRKHITIAGYDLERDFYKSNTLACRPTNEKGSNRPPTKREIQCCESNWRSSIESLKPNFIFLFGGKAVEAFFQHRSQPITTNLSINRWRKLCIPDSQTGAWILPLNHPSYVLRNPEYETIFKLDLQWALSQLKRTPPEFPDYASKIVQLTNFDELINFLRWLKDNKPCISFDYETSALKPYYPGNNIWTMSCGVYGYDEAYSWPYSYPNHWTSEQIEKIKVIWSEIMLNSEIQKVAQNIQMEHPWTKVIIGVEPQGWIWDTMVRAHVEEERPDFTSLDFQTFIHFGYEYGGDISKYKKQVEGSPFNNMHKAPLKNLLSYNGLDGLFTIKVAEKQWEKSNINDKESRSTNKAYELFHEGIFCFNDMQDAGIPVNTQYYEKVKKDLEVRQTFLLKKIYQSLEVRLFKTKTGRDIDINSPDDMKLLLYTHLGLTPSKFTKKKAASVDAEVLESIDLPFAKDIVKVRKIQKNKKTYVEGILNEEVDGILHTNFNLHLVNTYRSSSCLAKGTKIEIVRDVSKYPKGISIEDVKIGDLVYCYDNNLNPVLRKVLWAGKTGIKKIIRIHWRTGRGKTGFLDCTPDHLIRTINGTYIEASKIKQDFREEGVSKHSPKSHVLAMGRTAKDDRIYFTGKPSKLDHVFIYNQLFGEINNDELIHHEDKNHFNNIPTNLKKVLKIHHPNIHNTLTQESRLRGVKTLQKLRQEGKIKYKTGLENPNSLHLTKFQLLRIIIKNKGKISKKEYDFSTFKRYFVLYKINQKAIKGRWDNKEQYISRNKLIKVLINGPKETERVFGFNFYKSKELYIIYFNTSYQRKWGNQYGKFVSNNHFITKIEYLNTYSEVYDIQVEEFHNFIANEICVHNSNPNFHNLPRRDKYSMKLIRGGIIPSPGYRIGEADYGAMEVRIIACYSKDPVLIKSAVGDPHQEWADYLGCSRFDAKNSFVFALFYGSYYLSIYRNLVEKGYNNIPIGRVQKAEQEFWKKYKITKKFQDDNWKFYQSHGYIEMLTGFRRRGILSRNQVANTPIQGTAFHCLLWAAIRVNKIRKQEGWKTKLIGQIHDSLILNIYPPELNHVLSTVKRVMTEEIRKEFPWIILPLLSEIEVAEIDQPWNLKEEYDEYEEA